MTVRESNLPIFHEEIAPIRSDAYFIRKLLEVGRAISLVENVPSHITATEIARVANAVLAVSQKLEEGRKCNGTLKIIEEEVPEEASFVALRNKVKLDPKMILQLLIASPVRAVAIQRDASTAELLIVGFVDAAWHSHSISFVMHDRQGIAVRFGKEVIAAITPEAILTTNHITGQNASISNRDYIVGRTIGFGKWMSRTPQEVIECNWKIQSFTWLFRKIWEHGNGGCVVVYPQGIDPLRYVDSKLEFAEHSGSKSWTRALCNLLRSHLPYDEYRGRKNGKYSKAQAALAGCERALRETLDWVADLTRIDGALVIESDGALVAFGAKIKALDPNQEILVFDCIGSHEQRMSTIASLGGTRHQSAASFVGNFDGAFAFVASMDGRATLLSKLAGQSLCAFLNFHYLFEMPAPRDLFAGNLAYESLGLGTA